MLYIKFIPSEKTVEYIDSEFRKHVTNDRLNDKFSERIVLTIDKANHIKDHNFESPIFGMFNEEQLSTGCKACLLMYWTNLEINATHCGDNCADIIVRIAEEKDVTIVLEYLMELYNIKEFIVDSKKYNGWNDFLNLWLEFEDNE